MMEKTVITMAMVVTLMSLLVGSAPLSEMKHITLHIQKEVLEGDKLVIALEPLAEQVQGQRRGGGKTANNKESEMSDSTTPETEETTTDIPTNSSSSNTTVSIDTKTAIIAPSSSEKKEPGLSEFLVTVPELKCPEGQLPDPNGKCRDSFNFHFGSVGKSMSNSNFIPSNRMKNLKNTFGNKLIMG